MLPGFEGERLLLQTASARILKGLKNSEVRPFRHAPRFTWGYGVRLGRPAAVPAIAAADVVRNHRGAIFDEAQRLKTCGNVATWRHKRGLGTIPPGS